MPFPSDEWTAVVQPFWKEGKMWEFWKEADVETVSAKIERMRAAGVTCLAQEYGPYDARLWTQWVRVVCLRHPIDRLYSNFLHNQEIGHAIEKGVAFHEWAQTDSKVLSTTLYREQLGNWEAARTLAALEEFQVILVQEYIPETPAKMARHGWRSTDPEKHFKSWTPRRTATGRQVLAEHPEALRCLEARFTVDLQIYYRAVELALRKDGPATSVR